MISAEFDIRDFVDAVKDEDFHDILCLVNREATEAGRLAIRSPDKTKNVGEYANELKVLLSFLQYNVRPIRHEIMFGCLLDRKNMVCS